MSTSPTSGSGTRPTPQETIEDLRGLVVSYVRQETVEPLKALGRYVAFGLAGGLLLGVGVLFTAIGGLRVLQTETGTTFTGSLTWVPYGIVFGTLLLGGVLTWTIGTRRRRR